MVTCMTGSGAMNLEKDLSPGEGELLRELVRAPRTIRYGFVVLTVHDGRLVEIQKTEKIRKGAIAAKD